MYFRLGQLFWGLLFVILDVRVNGIDLLPDFLGYITVAIGARGLIEASDRFRMAANLSWILAILSLPNVFVPRNTWPMLGLVNIVFDCTMMWFLLGGLIDLALARGRLDLAEQAHNRRVAYLTLTCIVAIASFALRGTHSVGALPVLLAAVGIVIMAAMILHLVYRVRHEL